MVRARRRLRPGRPLEPEQLGQSGSRHIVGRGHDRLAPGDQRRLQPTTIGRPQLRPQPPVAVERYGRRVDRRQTFRRALGPLQDDPRRHRHAPVGEPQLLRIDAADRRQGDPQHQPGHACLPPSHGRFIAPTGRP